MCIRTAADHPPYDIKCNECSSCTKVTQRPELCLCSRRQFIQITLLCMHWNFLESSELKSFQFSMSKIITMQDFNILERLVLSISSWCGSSLSPEWNHHRWRLNERGERLRRVEWLRVALWTVDGVLFEVGFELAVDFQSGNNEFRWGFCFLLTKTFQRMSSTFLDFKISKIVN